MVGLLFLWEKHPKDSQVIHFPKVSRDPRFESRFKRPEFKKPNRANFPPMPKGGTGVVRPLYPIADHTHMMYSPFTPLEIVQITTSRPPLSPYMQDKPLVRTKNGWADADTGQIYIRTRNIG